MLQTIWTNTSSESLFRRFMTSCGMNSATGTLKWQKSVSGKQMKIRKQQTMHSGRCRTALTEGLKLLHPYMPFITEEIYCTLLPEEESIMISDWPVYQEAWVFPEAEKAVESFKEAVRGIRNTRTEMNVPMNRKTQSSTLLARMLRHVQDTKHARNLL